jgi:carbamoyl-phosphate synthase large subunit
MISVNDFDKSAALKLARDLIRLGFEIFATPGTASFFAKTGLPVKSIFKIGEGSPNPLELIQNGEVQMMINTPLGAHTHTDGAQIRAAAVAANVPLLTTLSAAAASVAAIRAVQQKELRYRSLQDHYRNTKE